MRYFYKIANLLFFFFKTRKYNETQKAPVSRGLLLQRPFISERIITITSNNDVTKDCHIKKKPSFWGGFLRKYQLNIKAVGRMYPSWIQPPNRPGTV
jgi:hypothetical protein